MCLGESDHRALGNLDIEDTSVLIHPRQREGQESWKDDV